VTQYKADGNEAAALRSEVTEFFVRSV